MFLQRRRLVPFKTLAVMSTIVGFAVFYTAAVFVADGIETFVSAAAVASNKASSEDLVIIYRQREFVEGSLMSLVDLGIRSPLWNAWKFVLYRRQLGVRSE